LGREVRFQRDGVVHMRFSAEAEQLPVAMGAEPIRLGRPHRFSLAAPVRDPQRVKWRPLS
jgi:hypothetical protein